MDLDSKMLLVISIVLIIGAVIGASVARVFADDPFKNTGKIDDEWLPAGVSDKVRIFPYPQSVMKD
jgi:hypothetical protein